VRATLEAGFGRRDITPDLGTPSGLSLRDPVDAIWDPLTVTVLVLDANGERAAVAGVDLMGILEATHRQIRERIGRAIGADPDLVVLNASHTHSAPYLSSDLQAELGPLGLRVMDDQYADFVAGRVAEAAIEAAARLTPVTVAAGRGRVERVAGNRRPRLPDGRVVHRYGRPAAELRALPEGVIDPDVAVLRFANAESGEPMGVLAVYACHPTAAGGELHGHVSADFCGHGRRLVESAIGAPLLFLQGCGGDVGTGKWVSGTAREDTVAMGERFAAGVMAALDDLRASGDSPFLASVERIALELEPLGDLADLERRLTAAATSGDVAATVSAGDALVVARRLEALRVARVTAFAVDDIALVCLPGEVFVEHGMAIRARSPFGTTLVAAYNDNTLQYIPTVAAFPDGEYEVDGGWRYIRAGEGERLVDAAVGLLRRLAAAQFDGMPASSSGGIQSGAGAIT
jgi:neutral/alkaline ceramidase-like enzyme